MNKKEKNKDTFLHLIFSFIGVLIGSGITLFISFQSQRNLKSISTTQFEVSKIQSITSLIPYISDKVEDQRVIAIILASELCDPELAIKLGLATNDSIAVLAAIEKMGQKAILPLNNVTKGTNDNFSINTSRKALKILNQETILVRISNSRFDNLDYTNFRNSELYINFKVSSEIIDFLINWGNEKFEKLNISEFLSNKQDENVWFLYSIKHKFNKTGSYKIQYKMTFKTQSKVYEGTKKINIEKL